KSNQLGSGKDWYGQSMDGPSGAFTHVNVLPGLVPNEQITYRYTLVASDETLPRFTITDGSATLGTHTLPSAQFIAYVMATAGTFEVNGSSNLNANTSQFHVAFTSSSTSSEAWIDWVEILYPRMLWGVNNSLRFTTPDVTGIAEYRLQQFASRPMIFRVDDPADVRLVSGVTGSYVFRDSVREGRVSTYWATATGAWKTPAAPQKMTNQDLRGYADGADFIILTSQEFRSAADRLKAYREQPENGGLKTIVVDVAAVYNEFGGGLPDITAIRDYLKYAYENWTPRPMFVLLFGGASFDYKGILGAKSSYVPTWQTGESRHEIDSYCTDDYFARFGTGTAPYLATGRISSRSLAEANAVVDKIIRYKEESVSDAWKMRILYIGDDSWTTEREDGTGHSDDAETLSSPIYTPEIFEKRKVYIAEYPTVFSALGRRKPGAAQDIIDQVNQGVLILNYSGHGNPNVWAHERIFEVTTSIPAMTNRNRFALFILATCNFSQFDDPRSYAGAELLMNKVDGGAMGVISASRKVFASGNAELNRGIYLRLFGRDAYGRVVVERPASALFMFKASRGNTANDQKFFYMGDPTTRLVFPERYAVIDSINGEPVDSVGGVPRQTPITLRALSKVSVSGTVRTVDNAIDTTFNGVLQLRVNDASRRKVILNFYANVNWAYVSTGGTIYRGENSITAGKFRAAFIVPKDISYADTSGRGRVAAYFSNSVTDGAGFTGLMRVSGTDSTAGDDGDGPVVNLYLDSRSFRPGDVVTEKPMLIADLHDSSGVNTSTAGIGHRIEAWINNAIQSKDITEFYSSTRDDYREGTVQYPLTNLPAGRNTVRVRAWDSYNNSTLTETHFEVSSSDKLSVSDVFNYPNPFPNETLFTFRQNLNAPLDVEVKVYTLAGRLIQSIQSSAQGEPMVRIPWDGRDRDGDLLANGVYLYKLVVRTTDGRFASEALGKLTVLR
ncbi:MAG: type IX secretion system sortase PorU, partial [Bacteroidetes bacterium]|nr:type IX secretion system sortase PorU [Bacteroidota bacterium]